MIPKKKQYTIGIKHALHGIRFALQTQTNFTFQVFASLGISFLGLIFGLKTQEWLILILTIFFVLTTELINSAIEIWVDSGILEPNIYAKRVKDLSAAAVTVAVLSSVLIGLIIFLPKLLYFFIF